MTRWLSLVYNAMELRSRVESSTGWVLEPWAGVVPTAGDQQTRIKETDVRLCLIFPYMSEGFCSEASQDKRKGPSHFSSGASSPMASVSCPHCWTLEEGLLIKPRAHFSLPECSAQYPCYWGLGLLGMWRPCWSGYGPWGQGGVSLHSENRSWGSDSYSILSVDQTKPFAWNWREGPDDGIRAWESTSKPQCPPHAWNGSASRPAS